jgi:nucleoside-diphosphate-sugar epimerase
MNVLVTGSCGFIGTNLCLSLLADGHSVLGIDSFTENYNPRIKKSNLKDLVLCENFTFLEADLLNADLSRLIDNKDVVFHLAGQPSVHNSWGNDFEIYTNRNILLTQKLLNAIREAGTPKFVNSSSSSIYGRVHQTPTIEAHEKSPISPYGVTKLAAENLVTLFGSEFELDTVSLRYFTVYGPRQRPDMAFSKLIDSARHGKSFPLHGDGSQVRDFTFVGDVVEANKLAAFSQTNRGSVFNIGGGSPVSMITAIAMLEEIMDSKIEIVNSPVGPGNPTLTFADCTAAEKTLGWKPKMDFYEGLREQVLFDLSQS